MDKAKNKEKDQEKNDNEDVSAENSPVLDGKRLYDLYRHTTKLIE